MRENIHKSDVQVISELYGHFKCLQVLIPNKITFKYSLAALISGFQSSRGKQYTIPRVWRA